MAEQKTLSNQSPEKKNSTILTVSPQPLKTILLPNFQSPKNLPFSNESPCKLSPSKSQTAIKLYCEKHNKNPFNIICLECQELFCSMCYIMHIKKKKHAMNPLEIQEFIDIKCEELSQIILEIQKNDEFLVKCIQNVTKTKARILDKTELNEEKKRIQLIIEQIFDAEFKKREEFSKTLNMHQNILSQQKMKNMGYVNICENTLKKITEGTEEEKIKFVLNQFIQIRNGQKEISSEIKEKLKIPKIADSVKITEISDTTKKVDKIVAELSTKIKSDSENLIQNANKNFDEISKIIIPKEISMKCEIVDQEKNKILVEEVKKYETKIDMKLANFDENLKNIEKEIQEKFHSVTANELAKPKEQNSQNQLCQCKANCGKLSCEACGDVCIECKAFACSKCANKCALCSAYICVKCEKQCEECKKIHCSQHKSKCAKCKKLLCKNIQHISCDRCSSLLCDSCKTICESCGKIWCPECNLNEKPADGGSPRKFCVECKTTCVNCQAILSKAKSKKSMIDENICFCDACSNNGKWVFDSDNKGNQMEIGEAGRKVMSDYESERQSILGTIRFSKGVHQYKVYGIGLNSLHEKFGICNVEDFEKAKLENNLKPIVHDKIIGLSAKSTMDNMKGEYKYEDKTPYLVTVDRVKQKLIIMGKNTNAYAELDPKITYAPCFCTFRHSEFAIEPVFK